MAKKKSEKSEEKAEAKPAAKKAAPAKKKSTASAAPQGTPLVDTNLAAQNAARMLAAGAHAKQSQQQSARPQQKSESSLFKQMKAGLNKPAAGAMGGLLDKSGGPLQKKPNQPFGGKQVGHNQTFGADATRTGVPRRTPG